MILSDLTLIILELNAALDSGKYDDLTMEAASEHIEAGDVIAWLKSSVPEVDLSLLTPETANEYQSALSDLYGGSGGRERKWGVKNRALCLLIAWTNELVQQKRWQQSR
jgi:hypothetical protein